jgi:hydrogenase nickel incorporation protein HypB
LYSDIIIHVTQSPYERRGLKIIRPDKGEIFDIELDEDLLRKNQDLAKENRKLLDSHKILAIDIMGSVGSGKTSLVTQLVKKLKNKYRIAALAGDTTTTIDAERIKSAGADVLEINTGKECHLDANLVRKALKELNLKKLDLLFIENVGNIICPADFPLGSHKRIVVLSLTEGPYVVLKHPFSFMDADVVAINKIDLSKATRIAPEEFEKQLKELKPSLKAVRTNSATGKGIADVIEALGL